MPSLGIIEVEMPIWGSIYDSVLSDSELGNYGGEGLICTSEMFDDTPTIEFITPTKLQITYQSANVDSGQVVISCSNWRNPISSELIDGFFIRTMDMATKNYIDQTESFSIDASSFSGGVSINE